MVSRSSAGRTDRRPTSSLCLGDVAAALAAMSAAVGQGLPVSRGAVRNTVRLIQTEVRAARGLPTGRTKQRQPGKPPLSKLDGLPILWSLTPNDSENG
jgi:hypothetical protein